MAPLQIFGLLQHESKLSVLNFGVKKAATFGETLPNKADLLLVTGLRYAPQTLPPKPQTQTKVVAGTYLECYRGVS